MIREFEFVSAGRILFGAGAFDRAASLILSLGSHPLVVTGRSALAAPGSSAAGDQDSARASEDSIGKVGSATGHGVVANLNGDAASTAAARRSGGDSGSSRPHGVHPDGPLGRLETALAAEGVSTVRFLVRGEPTTDLVDRGVRMALAAGCDCVVGLGGGSVLDAAKAIAGLMTNGGESLDYLEVVGRGRILENPAAPILAIPTTSGTGSEVTKNSVLAEPRAGVKASIRSPLLLPRIALVDPALTLSLPPLETAATGLDALTQLIETYVTPRANPVTDLLALDGIARAARALPRALRDGADREARADMALASLFGGLCLANAGLGAVHGIAAPLGGRHPVPHGVACALLLSHVFETNARVLRAAGTGSDGFPDAHHATGCSTPGLPAERRLAGSAIGDGTQPDRATSPGGEALATRPGLTPLDRMELAAVTILEARRGARLPGLRDAEDDPIAAAVAVLRELVAGSRLPGLASYGVTQADLPGLAAAALRASSMKGNPAPLTAEDLTRIIAAAL